MKENRDTTALTGNQSEVVCGSHPSSVPHMVSYLERDSNDNNG